MTKEQVKNMTKGKLMKIAQSVADNCDADGSDDGDVADDELGRLYLATDTYDEGHDTELLDSIQQLMDSDGIMTRTDAIIQTKANLKDVKMQDNYTDDPAYDTYRDNLDYLTSDDAQYVGPEWHGNFTGDRANFDAVHDDDVQDIAQMLYDYLNGKIDPEWPY